MNPQDAFFDMFIAALRDAVENRKMTQLCILVDAKRKESRVRVIVVPKKMDREWPNYAPLGAQPKEN